MRLDDLWIPLHVVPDDADDRQQPQDLDALEPELRLVLLRGHPGSGKSTWLKHVVSKIAGASRERLESGVWPDMVALRILLHASEVADALADRERLIRTVAGIGIAQPKEVIRDPAGRANAALLQATMRHYRDAPPIANQLWDRLTAVALPRSLVMMALDGWDECEPTARLLLAEHFRRYTDQTNARIFVVSRLVAGVDDPLFDLRAARSNWRTRRLLPVAPADVELLIVSSPAIRAAPRPSFLTRSGAGPASPG